MVGLYKGLRRFRQCETGAVISAELVIVGTVVAAGLATGWAALQQSVVSELRDFSEAISALDQTYSFSGHRLVGPGHSCLASSAGSRYVDTQILCDDAHPEPMSECCLSPVIVHDTTRPGHWHCDRCGHQHQPQGQPANQPPQRDAARGGSRQPAGPPPVPPVPPDHPRARVQPQAERQPSPPRPEPDPGPGPGSSRRPAAPSRKGERSEGNREPVRRQPERGQSDGGDSPFTPRENAPARSQKTSEGDSEDSGAGESNDITQSDLYMLARLPLQEPFVPPHAPAPPHAAVPPHAHEHHGPPHAFPPPVPEHPGVVHEHSGPIHEHAGPPVVHGYPHDGYPYSEHGYSMPPHAVHPRYEYRGHREPVSTPWGHGPGVGQRYGVRSGVCGGCGSCGGCAGAGSIRPGVEYYSGVRKVRVTEIPLSGPEPVPQAYGAAPYVPVPQPGFAVPAHGWPSGYRVNRHEPRFPDYVWQPVWQVVW